ncbi:MAG: hypothetical protein IJ345_06420 [Clostridia bacterium]|nr:hypothetical protein [Clostridia bacterium]
MKTFGRYLLYRLENSALRTVIFTIIAVVITQNTISDCIDRVAVEYSSTGLYILATVLGIICTLIPILETTCFKNRRNLDTLYFFPLKRWKMAAVHFLSGFIQVLVIYSVTFFIAYGYLAANTDYFALGYMPLYYLFSILLGFVMYSFFSFIFGQANTVADGVVICILWMFVLAIVSLAITGQILRPYFSAKGWGAVSDLSGWGIAYAPINNLTVIFQDLIEVNKDVVDYNYHGSAMYADRYISQMYMFFVWGAIGIASAVGYVVAFVKKGAEKAGEISSSIFGYKLLIPLYGYSLLTMFDSLDFMTVLILIAMVIGYIVYRRSFKLKASDLICTGCGVIAMILGAMF